MPSGARDALPVVEVRSAVAESSAGSSLGTAGRADSGGVERGGVSGAGGVEVGLGGDIEVYEPPHSLDEAQAMDDMITWEKDEAERKKREAAGPLRPR